MIPFLDLGLSTRELRDEIQQAMLRVADSGKYIFGEEVAAFESEFANYCGAAHCVGVGNGLDAITLMLRGLEIGAGNEVIVAANTYIATWLGVTAAGAVPVPVEPDVTSCNLDPRRVVQAITPRTRAILATHLYGRSADIAALEEISRNHGVLLLFDSAQAHGVPFAGIAAAFSFYPTKNLGALGDAGAVVTGDAQLAARIRTLGNYGSVQKYQHQRLGVNSRMDSLQAAILRAKLPHLDRWNRRRSEIARCYSESLADIPVLRLPSRGSGFATDFASGQRHVWHLFTVRHPLRDDLAIRLKALGVDTLVHYPEPPHLSGAYRTLGFRPGDFPITEALASSVLSLPLHPHLDDQEVQQVIESTRAACGARAYGAGR